MIHLLFDDRPWFRHKRSGFGSGLPMAWQGWLLLAAHIGLILGLSLALDERPLLQVALVVIAALAPMPIYAAKTEGGWKWRPDHEDRKRG